MIREVRPVLCVVGTPKWSLDSIGGILDDWVVPPGFVELPEDDERYPDYKDWKVDW